MLCCCGGAQGCDGTGWSASVCVYKGQVRAKLERGAIPQAKATCQRFVDGHPSDNMAIGQVRVLLAKAHLQEGNAVQAARIYQMALSEPTVHAPEVFYGLSLARARGVNSAAGEMALMSSTVVSSGEDVRLRIASFSSTPLTLPTTLCIDTSRVPVVRATVSASACK